MPSELDKNALGSFLGDLAGLCVSHHVHIVIGETSFILVGDRPFYDMYITPNGSARLVIPGGEDLVVTVPGDTA